MVRRARTLLLGAAVIGIALVLLARSREEPAPTMPATPAQEVSPLGETAAGGEREVRLAVGPGPHGLDSGGTLVLESQALAEMTSLSLDLRMPADAVGTEPPPVRVVAPDGRLLHAEGSVGENPATMEWNTIFLGSPFVGRHRRSAKAAARWATAMKIVRIRLQTGLGNVETTVETRCDVDSAHPCTRVSDGARAVREARCRIGGGGRQRHRAG